MDRNTRTLLVLLVALAAAGGASYFVYRTVANLPVREVEVAHSYIVAAAKKLPVGARVTKTDVKLIAWPAKATVPGSFDTIDKVVDRGVLSEVLENEPLTDARLAPIEGGAGLPPTIPTGMRALSVRVNDVVGVAGFVVPGTRVDVMVTLGGGETRVVVSNIQVLTAGTRYDQDTKKSGEAIPTSVVTLLVTPEDAERVVLASTAGQIMLTLRNPLDIEPTKSSGTRMAGLFGTIVPQPAPHKDSEPRRKPAPVAPVVEPPPLPPPVAKPYVVEAIRAAKRTEEPVR